jgi:2-polyprenyl-3-methyl-5-hydroxy-6-metoxy-1,4-benzoquinol methylase
MNRVEYILERVHGKVLHVGASTGPLHEVVRSRSERLLGLDLASREGDDDVHQGDVQDASHPIFKEHFDVILLGEVVEHLLEPAQALRNCASCCNRLVITTPNPRALTMRWREGLDHMLYWTPLSMRNFLAGVGLEAEDLTLLPYERTGKRLVWLRNMLIDNQSLCVTAHPSN